MRLTTHYPVSFREPSLLRSYLLARTRMRRAAAALQFDFALAFSSSARPWRITAFICFLNASCANGRLTITHSGLENTPHIFDIYIHAPPAAQRCAMPNFKHTTSAPPPCCPGMRHERGCHQTYTQYQQHAHTHTHSHTPSPLFLLCCAIAIMLDGNRTGHAPHIPCD